MHTLAVELVIENNRLLEEAQSALQGLEVGVHLERGAITDWRSFLERLERSRPDALLLDVAAIKIPVNEAVERIKSISAAPAVFVLQGETDSKSMLSAFRVGTAEAQLREALASLAADRQAQRASSLPGKTIGFVSAKGGCGATTIACHLAFELGEQTGKEVLLADYDLDGGIAGWLMNAKSEYSLVDAAKDPDRLDLTRWNRLVSSLNPRLDVIAAPLRRHPDEEYTPQNLREVLHFARTQYPFTVVDLGHGFSPLTRFLLQGIGSIYVVTTSEAPNLFQAKQLIQNLSWNGYEHGRMRVILNRAKKSDFSLAQELQTVLDLPVYAIPNAYATVSAAHQTHHLVPPESILGKSFSQVAKQLVQTGAGEETSVFACLAQKMNSWLQTPGLQAGQQ